MFASLPHDGLEGTPITAFAYNVDNDGRRIDGAVLITDKALSVYADKKEIARYVIGRCEKFEYRALVGACEISVTDEGGEHIICRGDSSKCELFAKNTRRLERLRETGEYSDDETLEVYRVCPKCGRKLPRGMQSCLHCADKRSMFKRLLEIAKPYRWYIFVSALLFFVSFALQLLGPYVNKLLVDGYIDSSEAKAQAAAGGAASGIVMRGFLLTILLMLGLRLIRKRRQKQIERRFSPPPQS